LSESVRFHTQMKNDPRNTTAVSTMPFSSSLSANSSPSKLNHDIRAGSSRTTHLGSAKPNHDRTNDHDQRLPGDRADRSPPSVSIVSALNTSRSRRGSPDHSGIRREIASRPRPRCPTNSWWRRPRKRQPTTTNIIRKESPAELFYLQAVLLLGIVCPRPVTPAAADSSKGNPEPCVVYTYRTVAVPDSHAGVARSTSRAWSTFRDLHRAARRNGRSPLQPLRPAFAASGTGW